VAYPEAAEQVDEQRFEWQSFGNPLLRPDQNFLFHLFDAEGRIVGQNVLIPYQLMIDGRVRDALCSTNLIVLPGMVGRGAGHILIERHEQEGVVCFAVGITAASSRAFQKRGWKPVDDSRLQALFLKPHPCLRYVNRKGPVAAIASLLIPVLNLGFSAIRPLAVPKRIHGITWEPIARFEPEWDQQWNAYLSDFGIHFVRSASFLNWKYFSRRDVKHQAVLFRHHGRPAAYLVYRLSRNETRQIYLGRIVDLVYDPSVDRRFPHFLIGYARRVLAAEQVDGIVGIASSAALRRAYWANGFCMSRTQPAIMREHGFFLHDLRQRYRALWYITLADSDLDNYW
jgi:hypothetical protein